MRASRTWTWEYRQAAVGVHVLLELRGAPIFLLAPGALELDERWPRTPMFAQGCERVDVRVDLGLELQLFLPRCRGRRRRGKMRSRHRSDALWARAWEQWICERRLIPRARLGSARIARSGGQRGRGIWRQRHVGHANHLVETRIEDASPERRRERDRIRQIGRVGRMRRAFRKVQIRPDCVVGVERRRVDAVGGRVWPAPVVGGRE